MNRLSSRSTKMYLSLLLIFVCCVSAANAGSLDSLMSKRIVAFAVYIDNPDTKWPGMDTLKDKLVETIVAKLNSMIINQILSGAGVLEGLKKHGVESLTSADPAALQAYGREYNISYVVLFSLRTTDWAFYVKAYDVEKAAFVYDGQSQSAAPKPQQQESSWSFGEFAASPVQYFMKRIAPALDEHINQLVKLFQ